MRLAEMGTLLGAGKNAFWVREVRKLTDSGHQTSLISSKRQNILPGANWKTRTSFIACFRDESV